MGIPVGVSNALKLQTADFRPDAAQRDRMGSAPSTPRPAIDGL